MIALMIHYCIKVLNILEKNKVLRNEIENALNSAIEYALKNEILNLPIRLNFFSILFLRIGGPRWL